MGHDPGKPLRADEMLGCPACREALRIAEASATCASCGAVYAIEEGVLCLHRSNVFMGEFDGARMREFAKLAREQGWRRTVDETMAAEHPGAETILLSPERTNFLSLLPAGRRRAVLDLGAGMGAVSLGLAKVFERVYSLDQTFERLAFLQVVADQERASAVRTVCHRDVFRLPFRSNALDAAVMIGVFEYFPASYPDMPVRTVQRRALAELYRVLAPGGVLFMATKNRFGWPYMAGERDNSGLRFGPVMPRPLANLASRALLGRPQRIVTDSYGRYRSLFAEAGFEGARVHWPIPGYQSPQSWVDVEERGAMTRAAQRYPASAMKRTAFASLARVGALKWIVPHFGIVARKPESAKA
jgi:SAM-dependent methyltransferase